MCSHTRQRKGAETQGILVIEIDDVLEAGGEEHAKRMQWLEDRLRFGKAVVLQDEPSATAYAGRRIQQMADFSYVYSMDDYVQGRLKPVSLERKILIKDAKKTPLNPSEESQLRGTIASLNWSSREGRPDAAAAASILAGCFPGPTVMDARSSSRSTAYLNPRSDTLLSQMLHSIHRVAPSRSMVGFKE